MSQNGNDDPTRTPDDGLVPFEVKVEVTVIVRIDPKFGHPDIVDMALEASSHNHNSPEESSVLDIPGYGEAEVASQKIIDVRRYE